MAWESLDRSSPREKRLTHHSWLRVIGKSTFKRAEGLVAENGIGTQPAITTSVAAAHLSLAAAAMLWFCLPFHTSNRNLIVRGVLVSKYAIGSWDSCCTHVRVCGSRDPAPRRQIRPRVAYRMLGSPPDAEETAGAQEAIDTHYNG
jgi:hypothetical protein